MRFAQIFPAVVLTAASVLAADQGLLNLVMPEAVVVAGIDVDRAKGSALGRRMMDQMNLDGSDVAQFIQSTGFDPRRDLREIIVATAENRGKNSPSLILIRGNFDIGRIQTFLTAEGKTVVENFNGSRIYSKPGKTEAFSFIDSTFAIAGEAATVKAALLRRGGGATLSGEKLARVQDMSHLNDFWLITSVPVAQLAGKLPSPAGTGDQVDGMMKGDVFKGIEQMSVGVRFAAEVVDLTAEAVSATAKDATAIADVVRFLSTMVQMQREKPEVASLAVALDGMKLTTTDRTTKLMLSLPVADVEKMMNKGKARATGKV